MTFNWVHGNVVKKQMEMEYGIRAKLVKVMTVKKIAQKNLNAVQMHRVLHAIVVIVECVNPNAKNLLIVHPAGVVVLDVV